MKSAIKAKYRPAAATIENHLRLAYVLVNTAESHAKKMLKEARTGAARCAKRAKKRARLLGLKQGKIEAAKALADEIKQLRLRVADSLTNSKRECLELAVSVAKEVIGQELTLQPDALIARIERAFQELDTSSGTYLFLNSDELRRLSPDSQIKLKAICPKITADDSLEQGNAILQASSGQVELNWGAHLERIAQTLRHHLTAQNE